MLFHVYDIVHSSCCKDCGGSALVEAADRQAAADQVVAYLTDSYPDDPPALVDLSSVFEGKTREFGIIQFETNNH